MSLSAVIGFDTSNYRTSIALVSAEGEILLNYRELLPVLPGERGLRQNDAVFAHIRALKKAGKLLRKASSGVQIIATASSTRPGEGNDSYMPVFEVGSSAAETLASAMGIPRFTTTHQRGHLMAALYGNHLEPEKDMIALHLSGGTTELLHMHGEQVEKIGGSLDLHAGQLVDRVGVSLGLSFPSGPELEKLALRGKSFGLLGCSMEERDLHCHFSGAESAAQRWIMDGKMTAENIAMEVYDFLARTVSRMLIAGSRIAGTDQALLAGGIASSELFRRMLGERLCKSGERLRLYYGKPDLCGDNAVGVALIGLKCLLKQQAREG